MMTARRSPIAARETPCLVSHRPEHTSICATYDIYGHLFEDRDRQAANALEGRPDRSLADSEPIWTPSLGL